VLLNSSDSYSQTELPKINIRDSESKQPNSRQPDIRNTAASKNTTYRAANYGPAPSESPGQSESSDGVKNEIDSFITKTDPVIDRIRNGSSAVEKKAAFSEYKLIRDGFIIKMSGSPYSIILNIPALPELNFEDLEDTNSDIKDTRSSGDRQNKQRDYY
jgi:hypothetical protein